MARQTTQSALSEFPVHSILGRTDDGKGAKKAIGPSISCQTILGSGRAFRADTRVAANLFDVV